MSAGLVELPAWDGGVEGLLPGQRQEILFELLACVDAARDRTIRLTKAGMPPKPLWGMVNDRLLWSDPRSILYDWDEVDQVRFVYSLADALRLIEPDEERLLRIGPGADTFYFAHPVQRTALLLRAYRFIVDWDERCDARNDQGNRFFFGQTFRRDFLIPVPELRDVLLASLAEAPAGAWVHAESLATAVTHREPRILISEEDPTPEVRAGESDGEIRRLVDYWLLIVARFGLVDLARTPEAADGTLGERLFRITPMGLRVLRGPGSVEGDPWAQHATRRPFVLQPTLEVILYRDRGDAADEYLLRRITSDTTPTDADLPVLTVPVTPQSLRNAVHDGLDPATIRDELFARSSTDVPSTFLAALDDAERALEPHRLVRGLTALELPSADDPAVATLRALGIEVIGTLALVPWALWPLVIEALGEIENGYEYPTLDALVLFDEGQIELAFQATPLASRDLLDALGLDADAALPLDANTLQQLAQKGWAPEAVAEAMPALLAPGDELPPLLRDLRRS